MEIDNSGQVVTCDVLVVGPGLVVTSDASGRKCTIDVVVNAAVVPTTYVVDSTVTSPSVNVFKTFRQAVDAALLVAGPKLFQFRDVAPVINIAGAYDLGVDPVTINAKGVLSTLTIAAGVTFTGTPPSVDFDMSGVTFQGASPLITAPSFGAGAGLYRFRAGCVLQCSDPAGRIVRAPAGAAAVTLLQEEAHTLAGTCFDAVGAGAIHFVKVYDHGAIVANTVAQSGGGALTVINDGSASVVTLAQAGMPGGTLVVGTTLVLNGSTTNLRGPGGNAPALQGFNASIDGVTGKSAFIAATVTATTRFPAPGVRVAAPGAGNLTVGYGVRTADVVVGLAGAGGGFKITAALADGTANTLDTSNLDAIAVN